MARVTGLEPATSGVTGRHSNRLSYTRALTLPAAASSRLIKRLPHWCQALAAAIGRSNRTPRPPMPTRPIRAACRRPNFLAARRRNP